MKASEDGRGSDADLAQTLRRIDSLDSQTRGQTVAFVAETGPAGLRLARTVDETTLTRLGRLDADSQLVLVDAWRSESIELPSKDIAEVTETLDGLDSQTRRKAVLAIDEAGEDGVWLVKNVPESRITTLVDKGIDLEDHAEGLGIIRRSEKTVGSQNGDVGEILAHELVVQKYLRDGWKAIPSGGKKGVDIKFEDGEVEFDHMIVDSEGDIIKVFETKISSSKADNAEGQLKRNIANLLPESETNIITTSPKGIRKEKMKVNPFTDEKDMITIGPKQSGYDESIGDYSSKELKELYKTAKNVD